MKNQVVVILGVHRSGTSMVANILHHCGVNMGRVFREPDEYNKYGYYEDLDFRALNKWIINLAGGTWYNPPTAEAIKRSAERIPYIISALIAHKQRVSLWGWKDPRTVLTIADIHPFLRRPLYICVRRNPDAILRSLKERASGGGYSESNEHWKSLIGTYQEQLNLFLYKRNPFHIFVDFERLVNKETSEEEVTKLLSYIGAPLLLTDLALGIIKHDRL